jgi:hypothetical protein
VALGGAKHSDPVALFRALQSRRRGPYVSVSLADWRVDGTTPSGEPVVATEVRLDDDPSRLYVLVGGATGEVLDLGVPDATAVLPVATALPQQQGWLVASFGASLAYRTSSGGWRSAGTDAALLPADARTVRVMRAGSVHDVALA